MPSLLPSTPLVISGSEALPEELAHSVLAIGNFDGVHRGHQGVLASAQQLGHELERPTVVLTFEPHPRSFFSALRGERSPLFRITPPPLKAAVLQSFGADAVIEFTFDVTFSSITAEQFIDDLLIGRYGASGIVVGHDFHFGKGRQGSPAFLMQQAKNTSLPVIIVDPILEAEAPISSSAIRQALSEGDIVAANHLLGYRWLIQGEVVHGHARGRQLGYPTANIGLDPACALRFGIYAVRARVDDKVYEGVSSFGRRPMFDDGAPFLETHLFDFNEDLYGKKLAIEFLAWLRPELKFDSLTDLVTQMDHDSAQARWMISQQATALSLLG